MIAFDTNILVHAHRAESPFHEKAFAALKTAAEGAAPWALTWPNVHEFLSIVTNARLFAVPTPIDVACKQVSAWLASPRLVVVGEGDGADYWVALCSLLLRAKITGPRVHDAHIAALALMHQVDALATADRDFSRCPRLKTINPLA
jgi:toxin-antitoxin system PIN domain toxin